MAAHTENEGPEIDLGFVEKTHDWRLLSHFFPSKVGGLPAWLSLKPLPEPSRLQCRHCLKPSAFLLQIYAPVTEKPTCFHRTLFMFVCRDPRCSKPNDSSNIRVFRSQLGRTNGFYSDVAPDDEKFDASADYPSVGKHTSVCAVCGCAGDKRCAKCHSRTYCGRDHQVIDWKAGHKQTCGASDPPSHTNKFLFPEYEIVLESENYEQVKDEKSEMERMQEYESYMQKASLKPSLQDEKNQSLEAMAQAETETDKTFRKFQKRIQHEPEQVLRYDRGGEPLWATTSHIPEPQDVPACQCGAARKFEFQVMPHLLSCLDVDALGDSIDWGTLAVFTCSASCDIDNTYIEEFVWKQDFTKDSET